MPTFSRLTRDNLRLLKRGAYLDANGKPADRITEHGVSAHRIETKGRADVHFEINAMVDGVRVHRHVGNESANVTIGQCSRIIEDLRSAARRDRYNLPGARKEIATVDDACTKYLEIMEQTGGKNLTAKNEHIRLHIRPYFKKMVLDKVSSFTLKKFRKALLDKDLANATCNRVAATWNHMASTLYDEHDEGKSILDRPLRKMKTPKEETHRDYVLSPADEEKLIEAASHDVSPHVWLFVLIALGTSMRHREVLSARYSRLDEERCRLRIRVKGGRWRDQPVPEWLRDVFVEQRESAESDWIFPSTRTKSGHIEQMSDQFRRVVIAAELDPERVTPHTLRHTAITRFSEAAGGDPATVQQYSGHQTMQMLLRYTHPSADHVNRTLRKASRTKARAAK